MTKRAAIGFAFALMLSACAKDASHKEAPTQPQSAPETPAEAQVAIPQCTEAFLRDYTRVYNADADLMNNRIYGNFSAMEDRINLVSLKNACETFYKNPAVESCRAHAQDATWRIGTADVAQICDRNRK